MLQCARRRKSSKVVLVFVSIISLRTGMFPFIKFSALSLQRFLRRTQIGLYLLLLISFVSPKGMAQDVPPEKQERPRRALPSQTQETADEVLRIETDLVTVDVTATDADGK